ncbi:MAG: type 4a pilus biogenesis protein PilO [Nitrosomonas sp.]|nr:type 4a pilus biogenesis protein PilO [Nitrosomonas sp.]
MIQSSMAQFNVNNWMIRLRWRLACLGNPGKLGAGMLALALVVVFAAILPQEKTKNTLKNKVKTARSIQASSPEQIKLNDDQALQVFYDFFPRSDSSAFWVNELDKIAKNRGIEVIRGDYRLVLEKEAKLARYEIQLPVRGSYPQLRAFIADALQMIPALALASVAIKRENIQTGRIDANLGMYLYLNDY